MTEQDHNLPVPQPSKGHYLLHYNPERTSFTGHTAAVVDRGFGSFFAIILFLLILVTSIVVMVYFPTTGYWAYAPYILLFVLPLVLLEILRPTHIEVNADGFRIHWFHNFSYFVSPWLRWNQVKFINYLDADVANMARKKGFDIAVDTSGMTAMERFFFEMSTVSCSSGFSKDSVTIRLLECGFFQEEDQFNFRSALSKHVSADKLDASVVAREEFGEVPSYTALWLNSFHESKNPELNLLPEGTSLADGRYRDTALLASGGQATVYEAVYHGDDEELNSIKSDSSGANPAHPLSSDSPRSGCKPGERCVLKEFVLPMRGGMEIKKRTLQNIQREASLLQSLDHPNIVEYRDLFVEGPRAYLVMEHIEGLTVRKAVEQNGPMPPQRVTLLVNEMCEILRYLHGQNPPMIHRDFTPENLILNSKGKITLIDFNVAHRLESKSTKTVVGKHAYVPPEQFRGKPTVQSDIFALGATLYYLLIGKDPVPLSTSDPAQVNPEIPNVLCSVVRRCTALDPAQRYQSVEQVELSLSVGL